MKKLLAVVALSVMALTGLASTAHPAFAAGKPATEEAQDMRKLWEDHIVWTRNWIISELANLPDRDAVAKRLLKNQDDIGAAVEPFYGDAAGKKLAALLRDHILIATEVVKAAKAGAKSRLNEAQKNWKANANGIAAFLASANPGWKESDLQEMLYKHLELTTDEAVARLKQNWVADIKAYDENHDHMLMFSDMLTSGIARQFPDKLAAR